jgi:8-oxo-dGTP diphosphatase
MADLSEDLILKAYANRLRVRVCGLCVQKDKLLLASHRGLGPAGQLWIPPGGGMELGQSAHANLQREFLEETGLQIDVGNLCLLNEHLAPPLHALELFFRVEVRGGKLSLGIDPELPPGRQQLQDLRFFSLPEIEQLPINIRHPILHDLDKLRAGLGGQTHFFFAK